MQPNKDNAGKRKNRFCKKKAVNPVVPQSTNGAQVFKESAPVYCKPKQVEKVAPVSNVGRSPLDTLETTSEKLEFNGSAKNDKERLKRRAQHKYFNQNLAINLAELGTDMSEDYRDTFYCSNIITVIGDQAKSTFCKRRWCIVCNNIRTAQLILKYIPTIETWPDKHFLTLTVKNPAGPELGKYLNTMHEFFTEIKDSERKAERKLIGIRKLEITFNPDENTYHPHFHIILKDGGSCEQVIRKWLYKQNPHVPKRTVDRIREEILKRIRKGKNARQYLKLNEELEAVRKDMFADPQFQDFKPADDKAAKYLFKYFVKLAPHQKKDKAIYVNALDLIFQNLRGRRCFQTFGFIAHQEEPAPENLGQTIDEIQEEITYEWVKEVHNWVSKSDGDLLTDFEPSEKDKERVKQITKWTPSA